jgi:hypothetical protein
MLPVVSNHIRIAESDGSASLTFNCGELPADDAIVAAGHEPNGYFWEGLVQYLAPSLAELLELDSEAGMFAVYGERSTLEEVQALVEPYLDDGERVTATISEAEAAGFQFDD